MNTGERSKRNAAMAARKAAGATWADVAAEFAVAVSTARQGVADYRAAAVEVLPAGDPLAVRADDALRDALRTYSWAIEGVRELAREAYNSLARVGAIRAAVSVAEKRINLLVTAGVIPSADAAFLARLEQRQREFAGAVLDALERRGIAFGEIAADVDRLLPPGPGSVAA